MRMMFALAVCATSAAAQTPSRLEEARAFRQEQEAHRLRGEAAQSAQSLRDQAFRDLEACLARMANAGVRTVPTMPDLCALLFQDALRRADERAGHRP